MRKVLFLCIQNTARSVMAESIFNSKAREWRAESAGIKRAERVDGVVARMLAERGMRVKDRPRTLDEVNLDKFDLIVQVCGNECLNLPDSAECWNIEDPAGMDEETYRKVYVEIERRVEELLQRLEGRL